MPAGDYDLSTLITVSLKTKPHTWVVCDTYREEVSCCFLPVQNVGIH